jgi:hypothetical protein
VLAPLDRPPQPAPSIPNRRCQSSPGCYLLDDTLRSERDAWREQCKGRHCQAEPQDDVGPWLSCGHVRPCCFFEIHRVGFAARFQSWRRPANSTCSGCPRKRAGHCVLAPALGYILCKRESRLGSFLNAHSLAFSVIKRAISFGLNLHGNGRFSSNNGRKRRRGWIISE